MGHRLSKIVTKTGDNGTTGITGNIRLEKYHPRIETIGLIDELNSLLGVGIALLHQEVVQWESKNASQAAEQLRTIEKEWSFVQHLLFNIGGELSMPGIDLIKEDHVTKLEVALTEYNDGLPPLKEFILPGGSLLVAQTHYIRAISRKGERALWALKSQDEQVNEYSLKLLNRLSDYFFVMARTIAQLTDTEEIFWNAEIEL